MRYTHLIRPNVIGFIIGGVNRNPQFFLGQTKPLRAGQQFPGVTDGVAFEIITEAEVTQHFEEGMVTRSVTHVFQIVMLTTGTHTTLRGRGSHIITFVQPQENILELVHPGIGKQQRRIIVWHQRTTGDDLMSFTMEKVEKRLTDLSGALAHNCPEIKLKEQSRAR